ncbi:hypothetical protein F7725_012759 [Dissostichus mawsoni]|uniref:Lipocalin/cytosolic fatty-acid binding domain-containing protein n=1 Tax=Dissostichus mawsoni TaxID=36200 RepID=A0A7J5YRE7_DISMA|nr:hypothetical protein F7725_012759 [Dissostichus mawsoni]
MAAQYSVPDPASPGKMFMNYQGLASYLSSGGDNYWVIDTDYENYALTYACRTLKDDGSCDDGYSILFSRNPRGLPPAIQRVRVLAGPPPVVHSSDSVQTAHLQVY